jgi:hypothetical protein
MPVKGRDNRVNDAISSIHKYQKRAGTAGIRKRWQLGIPVWQLAVEGVIAFAIAFICGLGGGVLFQVFSAA